MSDVHDAATRSYNMSKISGSDTRPEIIVRKLLFSNGFRYRKNVKTLPGTPDIVLPKYKAVVFVNGCFWHKHDNCRYFVWPKNNAEYWYSKIMNNVIRDRNNYALLEKEGWRVILVWECEIKQKSLQDLTIQLVNAIMDNQCSK